MSYALDKQYINKGKYLKISKSIVPGIKVPTQVVKNKIYKAASVKIITRFALFDSRTLTLALITLKSITIMLASSKSTTVV